MRKLVVTLKGLFAERARSSKLPCRSLVEVRHARNETGPAFIPSTSMGLTTETLLDASALIQPRGGLSRDAIRSVSFNFNSRSV